MFYRHRRKAGLGEQVRQKNEAEPDRDGHRGLKRLIVVHVVALGSMA